MYKIMIVDDEPLFADGLAECLREAQDPAWEVFKAYHARAALERLGRTPVDILLLDIRMPGMSGLELHREVRARWPRIKVLYLTGHDEFAYVQEALRQGGAEYILKTEGDEAILAALRKTANELEAEREKEQWMSEARERWTQAKSSLRRTLLLDIASGNADEIEHAGAQFEELDIPLRADLPVQLALSRVDRWPAGFKLTDRSLYLFAIQNIARDLLEPHAAMASVEADRASILWLMQPLARETGGDQTVAFAQGVLGQAQERCKALLGIDVSFALSERPTVLAEAENQYLRLRNLMFRHTGLQDQLFLVDHSHDNGQTDRGGTLKYPERLKQALERNGKEDFRRVVSDIADASEVDGEDGSWMRTQLYCELVALAVTMIQQLGLRREIEARFDLSALFGGIGARPWKRFVEEYRDLMEAIFDIRSREWERQGMDVVQQIKSYVADNLNADLSLTKIAERVSYHPAYLSRLYKQLAGKNLSDEIAELRLRRAKLLLADKRLKIQEVGSMIGFDSPRYFTKFFKSHTGMTPQEHRDRTIG